MSVANLTLTIVADDDPSNGESSVNAVFSIALQGMRSNAAGIQVVALNVANVHTDGFRAQRFDSATGNTSPRYESRYADDFEQDALAPSDVELATEFVDLKRFEIGYRANATVLVVADRLRGELLDLFG